ncbi:MAG: M18 family aminopeptidase [Oscillospiraceae bacterium]|nr:M18 family aminopeptidase [Oscillospiraceae bacterium]
MTEQTIRRFFRFLSSSPSSFHAVAALRAELFSAGYRELPEAGLWDMEPGGKYFVSRNSSSLISFRVPRGISACFHIIASHSDSPTFRLKPGPGLCSEGGMVRLNVERYGGAILSTWFDRPLSLAGRVLVEEGSAVREVLFSPDRDLLMIPSLAVHFNREQKGPQQIQTEMLPILSGDGDEKALTKLLASELKVNEEQILSAELCLVNRQPPAVWGLNGEFIAAQRLDDLECCYCSFLAFLDCGPEAGIPVHCVFDSEEVGSRTRQGAASGFLKDTLERIADCLGLSREEYHAAIASSFLVSADNAHALHPNYVGKADPVNRPRMNGGIVIKYQAEQRYATDAVSAAICKKLCRDHGLPFQEFTNNSDIPGGSTLGNISSAQLPLRTVDIGLAQLAMHSCYESAGARDLENMVRFSEVFYSTDLPELLPGS